MRQVAIPLIGLGAIFIAFVCAVLSYREITRLDGINKNIQTELGLMRMWTGIAYISDGGQRKHEESVSIILESESPMVLTHMPSGDKKTVGKWISIDVTAGGVGGGGGGGDSDNKKANGNGP